MLSLPSRLTWRSARSYATHASSVISSIQSNSGIKVLSSADDSKLTSSISVFIKAGSRYEPSPGLAHALKNMVFKATQKRSALSVVREAELLGGVLTSSLTREHLILSAEFIKGNEGHFAEVLGDVLTSSKFLPHEFHEETLPAVATEYNQAHLDATVTALDLAHQLAFRNGLGNSLFADPHSSISHQSALEYARTSFAQSAQHSVIGAGIESGKLIELVNQFFPGSPSSSLASSPVESSQSNYYGGDSRVTGNSPDTFLMAFKGGERSSKPEFTVLQHLLGSESTSVKWSQGNSPLSSLPVRSFHLPYSDIGLFGFIIRAPSPNVKSTGLQALAELKKVAGGNGVDKDSVTRAVKKAQFLVAGGLESNIIRAEVLGTRSLGSNFAPQQLQDLYASYSQVTPEQVVQAAKTALSSRPTTVAIGNTQQLPYSDDFGF